MSNTVDNKESDLQKAKIYVGSHTVAYLTYTYGKSDFTDEEKLEIWRKETNQPTPINTEKEGLACTGGDWEIRGNKIFVKDTNNSIAQIHVQKNYDWPSFKPVEDVEAKANLHILAASKDMYYELKTLCELWIAGASPNSRDIVQAIAVLKKANPSYK